MNRTAVIKFYVHTQFYRKISCQSKRHEVEEITWDYQCRFRHV